MRVILLSVILVVSGCAYRQTQTREGTLLTPGTEFVDALDFVGVMGEALVGLAEAQSRPDLDHQPATEGCLPKGFHPAYDNYVVRSTGHGCEWTAWNPDGTVAAEGTIPN